MIESLLRGLKIKKACREMGFFLPKVSHSSVFKQLLQLTFIFLIDFLQVDFLAHICAGRSVLVLYECKAKALS